MSSPTRKTQVTNVIQVSSGNFLEMYDFMAFGYFASAIGETYFPTGDHFASLMSSLMTFGVGFLMRPIGALILGAYIDRYGRRSWSDSHAGPNVGGDVWISFHARLRGDRDRGTIVYRV